MWLWMMPSAFPIVPMYSTLKKGPRYLELAEGYVTRLGIDDKDRIIGYEVIQLGIMALVSFVSSTLSLPVEESTLMPMVARLFAL